MFDLIRKYPIGALAAIVAGSIFIAGQIVPDTRRAAYEIELLTMTGDFYIIGSGDTCADAWQGTSIPNDWQRVQCVAAR